MRARTPAKSLPAREPAPPREAARPRMAAPPGGTSGRLRVAAVVRGSPARPAGSAGPPRARAAPSPPVIPSTPPRQLRGIHRPRTVLGAGRHPLGRRQHARPGPDPDRQAPRHLRRVPVRDLAPVQSGDHRPRGRGPGSRRSPRRRSAGPGRAGRLTPGGLRAAITRAVIEVAPDKAARRREKGTQDARVQRWMEDSGNAALMGRELPPADVLAADQRISWWAKQLKKAGLDGDMDQLRARAYLDILLGQDSRPAARPDPQVSTSPHLPPTAAVIPAGFAGRINLTIPLATLLDLAERPGEIAGLGPIDPALARDLANAAAASPQTTWCVTVTDEQGHATGHGCARPEPKPRPRPAQPPGPRPPGGPDPPDGTPSQGFTFTATGQPGPPGGYGHWRLATGIPGRPDLMIALDPIALDECDHRFQARGHDPGARLRHLSQIRHATCTGPTCRRPSTQADFEHNIPYEAGGRTCLCNGGPKCRHEHRLKQHPGWNVEQITPGTFRWTAPSGRHYDTEPTRYPILSRVPWGRPFRWISSRTRPERANGHDRGRSTPRYRGASPAVRGRRRAPP